VLELREVYKHYADPAGNPIRAVDGVSLDVAPGQFVSVQGPSGSGKTTFLMLMAALLPPDRGEVLFKGRALSTLSRRDAARYRLRDIGLVSQSFWLVPGLRAVDNAALKLIHELGVRPARRRVAPLLERVGLADRAEQPGSLLSMGESQRVAIVRALSNDPALVLADEPTGSLDSQRGKEIVGLLAELCRERDVAVVLVTHDPQAAAFADRTYTLTDGRLSSDRPSQLAGAAVPTA
jgi:putative ABC transport system ATP-binding protein